jgi:phosphoglycolate phosphatase
MPAFPFQIVGFDLDGTLLDTHEDLGAAVNHALALIGRPAIAPAQVRDLIGGGARQMLARALDLTGGVENIDISMLYLELIAYYKVHIATHTRLFPGGEAMLMALSRRGAGLAVVTNKLESLAVQLLSELGLLKRAPAFIDPPRAAFVGDTSFDILAARAAGIPCIAVSFGFHDLPAGELGADVVIDHFDELVPALERL